MDEETAQSIMSKYLKREWDVDLTPRRSGPDFLYKGKAVEVKGSDFRVREVILQFARYAAEYTELGIAFPTDALNSANLLQFHVLGTVWYEAFNKYLTLYLIRQRNERYGVMRIYDATNLLREICSHLKKAKLWQETDIKKLLKNVKIAARTLDDIISHEAGAIVDLDSSTKWLY